MKQRNNQRRLKQKKRRKDKSSKRHDGDNLDGNEQYIKPLIQPTLRFFDSDDNQDALQYDEQSYAEIAQDYLVEDGFQPQNCSADNTTVREKPKFPQRKCVQINQPINKQKNKKPIKKSKKYKKKVANPSKNFPSFFFRFMLKLAKKSQHANLLSKQMQLSKKSYSIKDLNSYLNIQEFKDLFIESLESNHVFYYILDSNKLVSIQAYIEVLSVYYQQIKQYGQIVNQTNSIK